MTIVKPYLLFVLSAAMLGLGGGCATLPKVSDVIDETPAREPPQILSAQGFLSPERSKALMERLKQSVAPTDMLQRYTAVIESVSGSPLTHGNKVTLLIDGPATYAAMFKAMEDARDHINLETFIIEDDETGHRFSELMLKKQAEGVQVNLIYDSVGSLNTPPAFFQRLRDAGILVVAFNPIKPPRPRKSWSLAHPDHPKILIVDGKAAFTGGVNISAVYSSRLSGKKQGGKPSIPWRDTDVRIEGPVEKKTSAPEDQGVVCASVCILAVDDRRGISIMPRCRRLCRVVRLIAFAAILCGHGSSRADAGPQPPWENATFPPYPGLENFPAIRVWDRAASRRDWIPPACTGWTDLGFTTLVATTARFRLSSGIEGLLRRIGAIPELAGIRYWSTTHKRWQTLVINAHALSDAAGDHPRPRVARRLALLQHRAHGQVVEPVVRGRRGILHQPSGGI